MQNDRGKKPDQPQQPQQPEQEKKEPKEQHSSAFREPRDREQKSTINTEEANLEQERKEAMTERD